MILHMKSNQEKRSQENKRPDLTEIEANEAGKSIFLIELQPLNE